ncbi:MAG: valine--tRNA ligase [Puniceicoccales bacterium]|jgi:valyl-tRNA synthetase|nr:valine--tRNA ligase [Puniceicoccales bacterium]
MDDLDKVFTAAHVEQKWTSKWMEDGCFDRHVEEGKESFCTLMPPPNVTGVLHMGHLLNQTLQDVFTRRARHCNKCVTWIPGTDHAGISMQVKVERELAKDGIYHMDIGREEFLKRACEWRDRHGGIILSQLKKLGVSCDFKNSVHTLDGDYSRGVLTAFVELYKRGYIYRGKRMINWCPATQTALSDEEVTMRPQRNKLCYVRYEIVERPGEFIEISTTRPETIMGDVAVAANPADERYENLIGLHCRRPLNAAEIPIIADEAVDSSFGTGALKITPAHACADFEIGQRHNLPIIDVLAPNGTLNANGGEFAGLDRFVAREKTVEVLRKIGALVKIEDHESNVGVSERGNVPIEPKLSEQWFLKYPKVEEAKRAVSGGFVKFYPRRWEKTYLHWMDGIKDWCISRQLWWGHRIPVWYKKGFDRGNSANWHISIDGPSDVENWERDGDVLDTWASSWIWPFGVFGWPDVEKMESSAFRYFYPTDVLVTGPDIIFFWVARMIISALEFVGPEKKSLIDEEIAGRIPFKNVYFTGIIRDKIGRKMSKSLGNSPEPLDLIAKYGADGVRFGILMSAPNGQDLLFNEDNMALGRNFCNKLWNAFRFSHSWRHSKSFAETQLSDILSRISAEDLDVDDRAMLANLVEFCDSFERLFTNFDISAAVNLINSFFWDEYCSWYVEASKTRLHAGDATVLAVHGVVMRQLLLILNPFIPFITEELWNAGNGSPRSMQNVRCETADDLRLAFQFLKLGTEDSENTSRFKEFLNGTRRLLSQLGGRKDGVALSIMPQSEAAQGELEMRMAKLKKLITVEKIQFTAAALQLPSVQTPLGSVFLHTGISDATTEREKIAKEIEKISKLIELNNKKLSDEKFIENAPANVVRGTQKMLEDNVARRNELHRILAALAEH